MDYYNGFPLSKTVSWVDSFWSNTTLSFCWYRSQGCWILGSYTQHLSSSEASPYNGGVDAVLMCCCWSIDFDSWQCSSMLLDISSHRTSKSLSLSITTSLFFVVFISRSTTGSLHDNILSEMFWDSHLESSSDSYIWVISIHLPRPFTLFLGLTFFGHPIFDYIIVYYFNFVYFDINVF